MRKKLILDWEAGRLSQLYFASTPLTFWADVVVTGGFESIWDLLMRDPTLKAQRLANPTPLDRWEFWMNEKDDRTLSEICHAGRGAAQEGCGSETELCILTQGAWRTLDLLLFLADRTSADTFLGSSWVPLLKPLSILFSFPRAIHGHEKQCYDEEECYTERLDVALRLFQHVCTCTSGSVSRNHLYQTSAHLMFHWCQHDLDQFCIMAQSMPAFHDICFVHLHLLCFPDHSMYHYLYGDNTHPHPDMLSDMLSWKFDSSTRRFHLTLSDLELQYRCFSLKWFLLRLSGCLELLHHAIIPLSQEALDMTSMLKALSPFEQSIAAQYQDIQAGLNLIQNEMSMLHG